MYFYHLIKKRIKEILMLLSVFYFSHVLITQTFKVFLLNLNFHAMLPDMTPSKKSRFIT